MLRVILIALVLAFSTGSVSASMENDALVAYSRDDYQTAARLYRELAENGNVAAQERIGFMYYHGYGVPEDYAEAAKWYRQAADEGRAGAQGNLGRMYISGEGVQQDYVLAYKWLILALAQNDPPCDVESTGKSTPEEQGAMTLQEGMALICEQLRSERERFRQLQRELLKALRKKMTSAQIAEAQRMAREWKPVHQ